MALSCLAGTNPVLPVNSRTSCPGKFENEIFLLFLFFFWKNKLILPRACFNNYPSIFLFCFARVWNHSSVLGRKFHYLAIVSMTCSQSNNMTHFFTPESSRFLHSSVSFLSSPWNLFFFSIDFNWGFVLFCYFFSLTEATGLFFNFFSPPSKWCP